VCVYLFACCSLLPLLTATWGWWFVCQELLKTALKEVAKSLWGPLASFRPQQEAAIRSSLVKKKHLFACWSTAAGKSGVYQGLGAVSKQLDKPSGVLFIAPLLALVEDQVNFLATAGFVCKTLREGDKLPTGTWSADFVFATPEAIITGGDREAAFYQALGNWKERLAYGVVDEIHLAAEWCVVVLSHSM
jgi:superfamily II DNA helicase RecQ